MKTVDEVIRDIRAKAKAETYININIKDIKRNKKEEKEVSALSPEGQPGSGETCESQGLCEPNLGHHFLPTATSSKAPQVADAVRTGSELSIHYAKITTRRARPGSQRRKINFDFVKTGSQNINKLTFSTTPKLYEWRRDLERDYKLGKITDAEWAWYMNIVNEYEQARQANSLVTIGKGNMRNDSRPVRRTAIIYTITEAKVYIQDWEYIFELEMITGTKASQHFDSWAEYWNDSSDSEYKEPEWV